MCVQCFVRTCVRACVGKWKASRVRRTRQRCVLAVNSALYLDPVFFFILLKLLIISGIARPQRVAVICALAGVNTSADEDEAQRTGGWQMWLARLSARDRQKQQQQSQQLQMRSYICRFEYKHSSLTSGGREPKRNRWKQCVLWQQILAGTVFR